MGVEPTSTGLQPVAWPSGSSVLLVSSPGVEPGPRPSLSRVLFRHTPRICFCFKYLARESNPVLRFRRPPCVHHTRKARCRVARPGIEPGPGTARRVVASEAVMRSGTTTGHASGTPTWNRTRTKTLGGSCAVRYTTGTKSRRLDLHQHHPVYRTGAFLTSSHAGMSWCRRCTRCPVSLCGREHQSNSVAR